MTRPSVAGVVLMSIRRRPRTNRYPSRPCRLEYTHQPREACLVGLAEARPLRAVEVEYPNDASTFVQGQYELRPRVGVAGDVPGELVDVFHANGAPGGHRRPAHAVADSDAHARRLALEWPEHELGVLHQVETGPVETRHRVPDERRRVGEVRDPVALVAKQRLQLARQRLVERLGIRRVEGGQLVHGSSVARGRISLSADQLARLPACRLAGLSAGRRMSERPDLSRCERAMN